MLAHDCKIKLTPGFHKISRGILELVPIANYSIRTNWAISGIPPSSYLCRAKQSIPRTAMLARAGGTEATGAPSAGFNVRWRHRKKGVSERAGGTAAVGATSSGFNVIWRHRENGMSARAGGTSEGHQQVSTGCGGIHQPDPPDHRLVLCHALGICHSRDNHTKMPRYSHQKIK